MGAIRSVSVWDHKPTAEELLQMRIREGWSPTPSPLKDGEAILGYAACLNNSSLEKEE